MAYNYISGRIIQVSFNLFSYLKSKKESKQAKKIPLGISLLLSSYHILK